jgi:DNA-binding PadR family transcriptional regulator
MSLAMSLLAILDQGPTFGLSLRQQFERRTGEVWPLNVGQVYSTLSRLERDELVRAQETLGPEGQKTYEITDAGRHRLRHWFETRVERNQPVRQELVLKLVMAASTPELATSVIQEERKGAVELLQQYTRLKREVPKKGDVGWSFLLDSLIFETEARVRWLDTCETHLQTSSNTPPQIQGAARSSSPSQGEVEHDAHIGT